MIKVSCTM